MRICNNRTTPEMLSNDVECQSHCPGVLFSTCDELMLAYLNRNRLDNPPPHWKRESAFSACYVASLRPRTAHRRGKAGVHLGVHLGVVVAPRVHGHRLDAQPLLPTCAIGQRCHQHRGLAHPVGRASTVQHRIGRVLWQFRPSVQLRVDAALGQPGNKQAPLHCVRQRARRLLPHHRIARLES